jgi:DNA-binding LytR/AlgR family response regulator
MDKISDLLFWALPLVILITIWLLVILFIRLIIRRASMRKSKWFMHELENLLNKYQNNQIQVNDMFNRIPIHEGNRIILFQPDDIVDFSVVNNHVFLTDIRGNEYLADFNLKELEDKLPLKFKRIHRSTIINTALIKEVRKLDNGRFDIIMNCDRQRILNCSKTYKDTISRLICI